MFHDRTVLNAMTCFYLRTDLPDRPIQRSGKRFLLLATILVLWHGSVLAVQPGNPQATQPASPAATSAPSSLVVTAEQIEAARKAAESDATLSDPVKQQALELLDQAAKWFQEAAAAKAELARVQARVADAPRRIEKIRKQLASPPKDEPLAQAAVRASDLEKIELAVSQEDLELAKKRNALKQQEDELSRLLVGAKSLSEDIAARTKSIEGIDSDLKSQIAEESTALSQARVLALKARRLLRGSELDAFQLRLGSLNLLTNLVQAERDLTAAEVARRQPRLDSLKQVAQQLREERAKGAREAAEELQAKTATLPAPVQKIAEENARYRQELEVLIQKQELVSERLASARRGLDEIKADFARTRERVDVVGASEAIVKMLRRRRDVLPSLQKYKRTSIERGAEISRATDRQIEIDELQRELSTIRRAAEEVLASLPESEEPGQVARLEQEVYALAQTRRDALNELQTVYSRYVGQLTTLDLAERQLVDVSGSFIDYIDDQLMWMPSTGLASLTKEDATLQGIIWLFSPSNWQQLVEDSVGLLQARPVLAALFLVGFTFLLMSRRQAPVQLVQLSEETRKIRTDSYRLTARAIWYTMAVALAWPILMVAAGWALGGLTTAQPFTTSIASALFNTGLVFGSLSFIQQACRPDNLGDSHLRWPEPIRADLLLQLRWFIPLAVSLGFLVMATYKSDVPLVTQGRGGIVFMWLMGATAFLAARLLRKGGGVMGFVLAGKAGSWLAELHFLWFPLAVGIPLALAIMSALGYHLTALRLEQLMQLTLWLFIGLFLLKELLLRALYITERRLRLEDALKRREELRAQRAQAEEEAAEDQSPPIPLDVPEVDFNQLSDQTKRLVNAGFLFGAIIGTWAIWNDLLPALGFLNQTALPFDSTRIVDGVAKQVPVTFGNLAVGLVIVIVTVLAAKNLPGLLEIVLLKRLPLDPGARYAITSLSQYTIAGIGIFAAFSNIGLEWSKLQWLVAALGVGLGFGLQEIVANFVSGIILLFERPIRVGDIVTVENTTGVVSRIRIRATTITNWDKQELLVPNKQFITGQLINWTLSDKMNRIVITVGVAYGSDVDRALELMIEAAAENENILDDPKPVATFEGFGDNALTLLLRAYLGSLDFRLPTISALHQAINRKFNEAGIVVAFPQRDLHLDSSRPLEIRMHRSRGGDQAPAT